MTYNDLSQALQCASVQATRLRFLVEKLAAGHLDLPRPDQCQHLDVFVNAIDNFTALMTNTSDKLDDRLNADATS